MNTATWVLDATPEITMTEVTDRKSWDALFSFAPDPHFNQAWCFGEGRRAEGCRVERLLFSDADGIAALCQLVVSQPLGLRITRIERGPVFLREDPSPELEFAVLQALRRRWRFAMHGLLLLAPSLPRGPESTALLRDAGFWCRREPGFHGAYLDLEIPLEEARRRFAPDWRADLERAEGAGLGLRLRRDPAAVDWLLERLADDAQATIAGPSPAFLRAACDASPDDFWLLQAMVNGEPEAALLVARFGQHAEALLGWSGGRPPGAGAANFLLWNALIETQRAGCCTLDLGGAATRGDTAFESGTHPMEYQLAGEWLAF